MDNRSYYLNILSNIHRSIFDITRNNFSIDIFLERGSNYASQEDINKAYRDLSDNNKKKIELEKQLNDTITEAETKIPGLYSDWIEINIDTCEMIISQPKNKNEEFSNDSTRLFVADELKQEWEKISQTQNKYLVPNVYYLIDYFVFFEKAKNLYIQDLKDGRGV